jgi:hypothetical protein
MLVICVSHKMFDIGDLPYGPTDPQIGDTCEVIGECIGYNDSNIETPCYELAGYDEWVYDCRDFATLPDTTADEMQEETKEAIVNIETELV